MNLNRYQASGIIYIVCAYVAFITLLRAWSSHNAALTMFCEFYLTLTLALARDAYLASRDLQESLE
jgi:hypothetical protein